jgi:hypothetical protein
LLFSVFSPCYSSPIESFEKQNIPSTALLKSYKKGGIVNNNNEDIINSGGFLLIIRSLVRMIGIY